MKTLKELQSEGYVSKCGRFLKVPCRTTEIWGVDVHGSIFYYQKQYHIKEMPSIKYGNAFYSKEHAELARDTMEAEQICRQYGLTPKLLTEELYKVKTKKYASEAVLNIITRFGEERLQEILNQQLKD